MNCISLTLGKDISVSRRFCAKTGTSEGYLTLFRLEYLAGGVATSSSLKLTDCLPEILLSVDFLTHPSFTRIQFESYKYWESCTGQGVLKL